MGVMALLSRTRLEPSVLSSLASHLGRRPRVLAWAKTADGHVVGLPGELALETGGRWQSQPWHEIDKGTWDEQAGRLSWTRSDGTSEELQLADGKRFADLFNERVTASIVFRRRVELGRGRYVAVALRRDLGQVGEQTIWTTTPGPGVDLSDPEVSARVDAVRADFGIS